jgi:hypothetical protein
VNVLLPNTLDVPETTPVEVVRLRPVGSEPAVTDHE